MNKITKRQLFEDTQIFFDIKITDTIMQNYIKIGLIKRLDCCHLLGTRGSVSYFEKNTPGIFYMIDILKSQGFELREIKEYFELLKLDTPEKIEKIRKIKGIDRVQKETINILFNRAVDVEDRNQVLRERPAKLLVREKFKVDDFEDLKKIIELRAYAELDYAQILDIIIDFSKDLEALNMAKRILDNPETIISPEIPEIKVIYSEPFKKQVLFSKDKISIQDF
jgi:hypothetical protein